MNFINIPTDTEIQELLPQWSWIVPTQSHPLYLSAFGDWVFGNSDGSISILSMLEGTYDKVANNSAEFNFLNKNPAWRDVALLAEWYPIAIENGLIPKDGECIGWRVHPIIGGQFKVENLQIFSMRVYQSLMSQLHAQLQKADVNLP